MKFALPLLLMAAAACGGGGNGDGGAGGISAPPVASIASVIVTAPSATLEVGKTFTATAQAKDAGGTVLSGKSFTWSSSSDAIATVSSDGLVTGVAAGSANISATSAGVSGLAVVSITPVPVSTITVSLDKSSLLVGQTAQASATLKDANGNTLTGRSVAWTTSNSAIATVTSSGTVTAINPGSATISAAAETKQGSATVAIALVPVATVDVSLGSTVLAIGGTTQAAAVVKDANGAVLSGRSVAWSSGNAAVASVSATGLVTAVAAGTSVISGTSETKVGSATITVSAASAVSISSISPAILIEGASATITGTGFAAGAVVSIGGSNAAVVSVSATQLQVTVPARDCQPEKRENVVVTVGTGTASSQATVKGADPTSLNSGFFMYTVSDQCVRLAAAPAGAKYLVGMLSTSSVPSSVSDLRLFSITGDVASISSLPASRTEALRALPMELSHSRAAISSGPVNPSANPRFADLLGKHWQAEARLRSREAATVTRLSKMTARTWLRSKARTGTGAGIGSGAALLGDTLQMRVIGSAGTCGSAPTISAVVRFVGSRNIWLDDAANPSASFTASEYQAMESFYAATTEPVLASYAGAFTDIDGNQRNLILITKEVNKQQGPLGFVWSGDLYPRSLCSTSNVAEIFYGIAPDPTGIYGAVLDKNSISQLYRRLMAHELTHIIQFGEVIYGGAGNKSSWQYEGGATLSEQLVGFRALGFASGQNLGLTAYNAGDEWFGSWGIDLARYFGFVGSSTRTSGAPEQCSWIGRPEEGNASPCANPNRSVYGVPATLLRFVLDKYGPTYPGGESALMRNIVSSASTGYASLTTPANVSTGELLTRFGIMLWSDDKTGNSFASWNLASIWSGFVASAQLVPYTSSNSAPTLQASVRAGSTAYLEWSPASATLPTTLRLRSPSGAFVPSTIVLWIYRYQ